MGFTTPATKPPRTRSASERRALQALFNSIDVDGSGYLDVKEMTRYLEAVEEDPRRARLIIRAFDGDEDGEISFDEFWNYAERAAEFARDPSTLGKVLYDAIITPGAPGLNLAQMIEYLECFGLNLTMKDAREAHAQIDQDHDGYIDFDDILATTNA